MCDSSGQGVTKRAPRTAGRPSLFGSVESLRRFLFQRALRLRYDGAERFGLVHRNVREHLPVERDSGELQRVDKLAIGQSFGAHRSIDSLDPERAEAALLHLAVTICVLAGLLDGLTRDANSVLATAVIALRLIENALVLGAGGHTPFDSCHGRTSLLQAVGRPALHRLGVGVAEDLGAAVLADIFGVVADQAVALAGDTVLDLARSRELEAFLDAALGLELGHFRLLTFLNGRGSPFGRARSIVSRSWKSAGL